MTANTDASAAHLKFLSYKRQMRYRNFKWTRGTGKHDFLVPLAF